MKKILTIIAFLLLPVAAMAATSVPWQKTGSSIAPLYIGDSVGIGTNAPIRGLQISGANGTGNAEFVLTNTDMPIDSKNFNIWGDSASGVGGQFFIRTLNDAGNAGNKTFLTFDNDSGAVYTGRGADNNIDNTPAGTGNPFYSARGGDNGFSGDNKYAGNGGLSYISAGGDVTNGSGDGATGGVGGPVWLSPGGFGVSGVGGSGGVNIGGDTTVGVTTGQLTTYIPAVFNSTVSMNSLAMGIASTGSVLDIASPGTNYPIETITSLNSGAFPSWLFFNNSLGSSGNYMHFESYGVGGGTIAMTGSIDHGSGDYDYFIADADTDPYSHSKGGFVFRRTTVGGIVNNNLGIGFASPDIIGPTYDLSFGPSRARTIGVNYDLTSGNPGNPLTMFSGGAGSTATNGAGGNLTFNSGSSTGNGGSNILFQTVASGQGTGMTVRGQTLDMTLGGKVLTFNNPTSNTSLDFTANNKLTFTTNSFIVNGTGNVGLGTTTPQSKLQVTSGASATTTVTVGELGLTSSKSCVNMNRSNGLAASFYINAAGTLVVETNYCK